MPDLAVVMPCYNEQGAVGVVVPQWLRSLRCLRVDFALCIVDDGSSDGSPALLRALAGEHSELRVIRQANAGHGQACLAGYRLALETGAGWILQIDSDGQCDPGFFETLWSARERHPVVYGFRRRREDGVARRLASRLLCAWIFLWTGVFVRDANVPYRLMRADAVADALAAVPANADLANIFIAVRQQRAVGIAWRDIVFRARVDGRSHLSAAGGLAKAAALARSLRAARRRLRG